MRRLALYTLAAWVSLVPRALAVGGVTPETLLNAQRHGDAWIHYGRDYGALRYVPLDAINRGNVGTLAPKWIHDTQVSGGAFETSAIVYDGKMYLTTAKSHLICVDPRTGETIWRYDHKLPKGVRACCGPVNRGVAISGNRVYYTTLDAHLLCFDAHTGLLLWERTVVDYRDAYAMTGAPLIVKDLVIVGVAGGEFGIRGFVDAYNADTGAHVWRFYTIPGPGEPGNETWSGDSWAHGSGATWITGTYDPGLNLIYWGVGNPGPDFNGAVRLGDNLYTDSVVALDADTGKLAWYFQMSPHDNFDWDGVSEPMLIDEIINGQAVKAMVQVNRNGYLYALDRSDGRFLYAEPYSKVNWANIGENGVPVLKPELTGPGSVSVFPGLFGGKNCPPAAYSPKTHFVYIPDMERGSTYTPQEITWRRGLPYFGGRHVFDPMDKAHGYVKAVDVRNGALKWVFKTEGGPNWGGMLATGGGLVFNGDQSGLLRAFNDETGEVLWEYDVGEGIAAPPTSFELDGRQYLGLAVGWRRSSGNPSRYILFGLNGK